MTTRTYWRAQSLKMVDEPLLFSLVKYRLHHDRHPAPQGYMANLVSSRTIDGKHLPILDLDIEHVHVESTTPGHAHLYINKPLSKWKWFVLMTALRYCGLIELGFYVWSLRRGGNFVRLPGAPKTWEDAPKPTYGWLFKLRHK